MYIIHNLSLLLVMRVNDSRGLDLTDLVDVGGVKKPFPGEETPSLNELSEITC